MSGIYIWITISNILVMGLDLQVAQIDYIGDIYSPKIWTIISNFTKKIKEKMGVMGIKYI